jgi:type II secretion system protein D
MLFRPFSFLLLGVMIQISVTKAQQVVGASPTSPSGGPEALSSFQAINASVDTILMQYEQLTGKVLIKDSNLSANALPITISVPQPVPRSELVRLIEASLLLNNIVLVPAQEPNTVKVININTGKNPRSEGVRLYTGPESIPPGEQVISYYMPFKYISANEALTVFQTHILPRAYTSFVPINSAQALLITESTTVIRQLVALQALIDFPPAKTVSQFVPLVRADAERVADTINKLMDYQRKSRTGGEQGAAVPGQPVPQPGQPAAAASSDAGILSSQAQIIADTRTNRILVIARPETVPYFITLIQQFDAAVGGAEPLEYRLRYISAGEVLSVLQDVLTEDQTQATQGQGPQNQPAQTQNRVNPGPSNVSSRYGTSSSGAGSVGAGQDLLQEPDEQLGPQAVIVARSRIISDPKDNKILVIGPPESVRKVRTILDKLDRRPQQVYLSTVIGQLELTNDFQFGVDWLQTFKKISGSSGIASANINSDISTSGFVNGNQIVANPRSILSTNGASGVAFPALSGLTIYGAIGDAVSVFVKALDSRSAFKVLARPAVYTANNKRAVISSGQRVPVPQSTLSNLTTGATGGIINNNNSTAITATINYEDVELHLEVIPLINANNEVTLKVAQINDTLGSNIVISGTQAPIINSQRLTTTVTVPSGATVVLGGLIQDKPTTNDSGIPYLKNVPYLGNLFKYQTTNHTRDELLVFIQPSVVNDDVQTLRASLKEERRAKIAPDTYDLAHPSEPAGTSPAIRVKKKKNSLSKEY